MNQGVVLLRRPDLEPYPPQAVDRPQVLTGYMPVVIP